MTTTERDRTEADTMRRWAHVQSVQRARAAVIVAEREYAAAVKRARAGGCTDDEINAARAMIDRSAGR